MEEKETIHRYYNLRDSIDEAASAIVNQQQEYMNCHKGCDSCCMAIRVFPVEFYAIRSEIKEESSQLNLPDRQDETTCRFLVNHQCTIYKSRPIICRTHGLPLLYMNSEGTAWELSHCELNFREKPIEDFHMENTLVMDTFNSKLFQINQAFLTENNAGYEVTDRIPLSELLSSETTIQLS